MSEKSQRREEYVKEWKERISTSEKSREKGVDKYADKYVGFYKNHMWQLNPGEKIRGDLATVNLIYPLVSIILETCYNRNPYIYVSPTRPDFALAAQVIEFLINNVWYNVKVNREIRRCIKNATLQSLAPVEFGYTGQYDDTGLLNPQDLPYVRAQSPKDFVTDDNCTTFDDEQSLFRGFKRKVSYTQFKKMYPKAAKQLKPKLQEKARRDKGQEPNTKLWPEGIAPWTRIEYWQVQDLLTDRFYFVHTDLEDFVDVVKNPYHVEGFLSEVLVFNEVPDQLWPMSDVQPIEFQQKELNKMRTHMMRHWKKLSDIYVANEAIYTEEDLNRIVNAEDVEYVRVRDTSPEALRLLERGNLSRDFYEHHGEIKGDYREISGISEYYRGGTVPGTKTAYETRQVQQGTAVRLQGHARAVTDFTEMVARKLIQVLKQFYTLPIVSRVAGPRGEIYWRQFSREQIQAEVDVRVHLGDSMPPDKEQDKMMAPQFYQLYRQDPLLKQYKVVKKALEMSGVKDAETWFEEGVPMEPMAPDQSGVNQGSNQTQGRLRMMRGMM